MNISKGLYEVITSRKLTKEQKLEAVPRFAWPIYHLDGEHEDMVELGEITEEDAELICEAIKNNNVESLL